MYVIATAGHVDHGKSTLVRALTGMEPDRWAEERRRGMTIDLGFAWTLTDDGRPLAFVDVPGHHRFLSNMLAGLGPAPAVMVVVAADEGWCRQSEEHLQAIDALGIDVGLLVVTRSDLADPTPATEASLARIAQTSLGRVEAVPVSGFTGDGIPALRGALSRTVARLPAADPGAAVRLWVDRSFTITGSGTVVTGTLGAGQIRVGDVLDLNGRRVTVRGLQSLGREIGSVTATARVALNLRGVARADIGRGQALLTPDSWFPTTTCDAHVTVAGGGDGRTGNRSLPGELVLHVGSAGVPVRIRPLSGDIVRLTLSEPLPLRAGDRAVLRDPGQQHVTAAAIVLDADPPLLTRRGAARARADDLIAGRADLSAAAVFIREVTRRGAVREDHLRSLGVHPVAGTDIHRIDGWLISPQQGDAWRSAAEETVAAYLTDHPLEPGMPAAALGHELGIPDRALIGPVLSQTLFTLHAGRVTLPGQRPTLGPAEPAMAEIEARLTTAPFAAPDRAELERLGLGNRELTVAQKAGRLLRLGNDVILLPSAPSVAVDILTGLDQPFTTSQARQALKTTRRVVIPLLEHLDDVGATEQLSDASRILTGN